jgi:hypothetical protein
MIVTDLNHCVRLCRWHPTTGSRSAAARHLQRNLVCSFLQRSSTAAACRPSCTISLRPVLDAQATLIREVSAIKGSLVIAQPGRMTKMSILSTKEPVGAGRAPIATPEIVREVVRRWRVLSQLCLIKVC